MTYRCLIFVFRKEDTSPTQFRDSWEAHVRMLFGLTKPLTPLECTRHYPARASSDIAQRAPAPVSKYDATAPLVLLGNPEDVPWDGMAEFTFRDELHFQQFYALLDGTEVGERIADNEAEFSEPSKMRLVVIGETAVTKNGGD